MRAFAAVALGASVALTCGAFARASEVASDARAIDVRASHASFTVTHLYLTHVTGSVPIAAGTVSLAPGSDVPTGVTATLDPKRIASGDPDRDDDLQGPDWFDTKDYPTWTYSGNTVSPEPGGFAIEGTLTVRGVARPVELHVTIVRGLPDPLYHAVAHVDRHSFGMRVTPMDALIGGDVEMTLDVRLDARRASP